MFAAEPIEGALNCLDERLAAAVAAAKATFVRAPGDDPFRGDVDGSDIERLLGGQPIGPSFAFGAGRALAKPSAYPSAKLAEAFTLDGFELDMLVLDDRTGLTNTSLLPDRAIRCPVGSLSFDGAS